MKGIGFEFEYDYFYSFIFKNDTTINCKLTVVKYKH